MFETKSLPDWLVAILGNNKKETGQIDMEKILEYILLSKIIKFKFLCFLYFLFLWPKLLCICLLLQESFF